MKKGDIVHRELLETSVERTTETVCLTGYESMVRWILLIWVVVGRQLQRAVQRAIFAIVATGLRSVGQSQYLPYIPTSIADPPHWRITENRPPSRRGRQMRFTGSYPEYPDGLFRFQATRLAVS